MIFSSFLYQLRTLTEKIFLKNISTELSKLQSRCPWGKNWVVLFNRKDCVFSSFLDMEPKIFGLLGKVLWQKCKNWILRVHSNILRIFFGKKNTSFLVLGWNFLASYQVNFSRGLRTAFYVSKGTFWGKLFWKKKPPFHDTEWKTFALLLNLVQRCCQNCILRVHRETLVWDFLIEKICFLHFYGLWAKYFGPSDRILMAEFWKLHPTCH